MQSLSRRLPILVCAAVFLSPLALAGALPGSNEEFRYSWRLRGGLAWVASLKFPTSGVGELKNVSRGDSLDSQLLITSKSNDGFYVYKSEIDPETQRTLTSYNGYSYGEKYRKERTLFDYVKRIARIRREEPDDVHDRVKSIPTSTMRDVLTGIHYLRQNAGQMSGPVRSEIYSDGKVYPVLFKPAESGTYTFEGQRLTTRAYLITAAPGSEKKWPGGIRVWLTDDDRHIPVRIEIQRSLASLQLDLKSMK
jgi:hypothetical protein